MANKRKLPSSTDPFACDLVFVSFSDHHFQFDLNLCHEQQMRPKQRLPNAFVEPSLSRSPFVDSVVVADLKPLD